MINKIHVKKLVVFALPLLMAMSISPINNEKSVVTHKANDTYVEVNADSSNLQTVINSAGTSPTKIVMTANYEHPITIASSQDIVLDLNGYVLDGNLGGNAIKNDGTLTIIDSGSENLNNYFKVNSKNLTWKGWPYNNGTGFSTTVDIWDRLEGLTPDASTSTIYTLDELSSRPSTGSYIKLGGCITGGGSTTAGSGIVNKGTLTINGGNIVGNYDRTGGGVLNDENGNFTLLSGNIVGNGAIDHTGGVLNKSTFTMKGGFIGFNFSRTYGGVTNQGTSIKFDMTGGEISYNLASESGDWCGGINIIGSTDISIGGKAVVKNNKISGSDLESNLYLPSGQKISVSEENAPEFGMSVGITMKEPGEFSTNTVSAKTTSYFSSDNSNYSVGLNTDKKLTLGVPDCTITFNLKGYGDNFTRNIIKGYILSKPTDPTKEGYTFGGWYKDENCTTAFDFDNDVVTEDITLYAKWTINNYTVTFKTNGGSNVNPSSVNYGGKITKPTDPTKVGYTFSGWYKDENCTTAFDFDNDVVTEDTTLYAKWTINSYNVTFKTNGGSNINPSSVNYGSKITKPTNPTKAGYTFGGWYKDTDCTTAWDFDKDVVSDNTTLYAKWTINNYTINLNTDGDMPGDSFNAEYGSTITKPNNPTKEGYTFSGWYKDKDCTQAWDFDADTITADTTLYAKWLKNVSSPTITNQPISQSVDEKGNVTFSVIAEGDNLSYQWYVILGSSNNNAKKAVSDLGGTIIEGATSSTLTIDSASLIDSGNRYYCVVTSTLNGQSKSISTDIVTLTINSATGLNGWSIFGIIAGTIFGLLLIIYLIGYFFYYREGRLDNSSARYIYKILPRGNKNLNI